MSSIKENTGEAVLEYMKEKIVSGEWSEGTKITKEVQLAEELGVSRTSVRAAMDRLVAMGVLVRKKRMGTFVKETSPQLFLNNLVPEIMLNTYDELEILDFREVFETECTIRFAERHSEEELQKLESCIAEMEKHVGCGKKEFADADLRFHMTIVDGCNNSLIIKVMGILQDILGYYQQQANRTIGSQSGVSEHKRILEAIREGDGELAGLLMKRHIQRSRKDINQYREKQ